MKMEKVVSKGIKIDLHIHSIYSQYKDKDKVKNNTLKNIPTLVSKLTENDVQMCAITDHDSFGLDVYSELKKYENSKGCSLLKVLPGVEFSVEYIGDNKKASIIHVITIFNDDDIKKIECLNKAFSKNDGTPDYDCKEAFSEKKFLEILKNVDLDVVLIAHQKNSITSKIPRKRDANSVGEKKFQEFLYTDYFEALEFKNKNNEIFNKAFSNAQHENISFITGSDCHNWNYYPQTSKEDKRNFSFTYVKCLPTFRGLVMAITDYRRIKMVNSFFDPTEKWLKNIDIKIGEKVCKIPLSKGVNVIIGDNSIGKSLLLHKMTGYSKSQLKSSIRKGYDKYLQNNNIEILTTINKEDLFYFDMQGEVRARFENGKHSAGDFLAQFYPKPVDAKPYRVCIENKIKDIFTYLQEKFILDEMEENLEKFLVYTEDVSDIKSLTFADTIKSDAKSLEEYNYL